MNKFFILLVVMASSLANAQSLEERVSLLESKFEKLESRRGDSCLTKVDGFVTRHVYWAEQSSNDGWTKSNVHFSNSFDFQILKEFKDSRGQLLLAIRIDGASCSSYVIFKRDAVLLP